MQSCQNPDCSSPFNPESNKFCQSCGKPVGDLFRNRYRVLQVLGEGGFGKTYQAQDAERLDDPCVIKQFAPQISGTAALNKATELFKQEATQLYQLGEHHRQIPRLIAYFEQGKNLYLVQEFIQGQSLLAQLNQQAFTEAQIREFLADLLPVLQFVHSQNVIHRDIKPDNIIRRQADGKYVLIDFGGAKQISQTNLGRQGTGLYTIGYAPTEQMAGRAIPASDLYALGATCARLLTQCVPIFNAYGDVTDDLYDADNAEWLWRERLEEKGKTISNELGAILDKLLQHLPKHRYKSAEEVLQDLNPAPQTPTFTTPTVKQPTPTAKQNIPLTTASVKQPTPTAKQNISTTASVKQPTPIVNINTQSFSNFEFEIAKVEITGGLFNKTIKINGQRCQGKYLPIDLGNGIIIKMVSISGGEFWMGSPDTQKDSNKNESPVHKVRISPFFIGQTQVTQAQWKAVAALPQINKFLDLNPSNFKGINLPVEQVSWHDAVEFCARLSKKTGIVVSLPSEAQWEYACRAGTNTLFHFGERITPELANFNDNRSQTTNVASFPANAFGLYDMHGNVWEWCADHWHSNYNGAPNDGSIWLSSGESSNRIIRGGSWYNNAAFCRSAIRLNDAPNSRFFNYGFRIVSVGANMKSLGR